MATTAVKGGPRRIAAFNWGLAALAAIAVALAACIRAEPAAAPPVVPAPPDVVPLPTGEPQLRVGLLVEARTLTIGGGAGLRVVEPDGALVARLPPGSTATVSLDPRGVAVASGPLRAVGEQFAVVPDEAGIVRVNGREYRGEVALLRDRNGVTVVNRVGIEAYLEGVVNAEMGTRGEAERTAVEAQAIVSRTYALRNLGRWREQGFDLRSSVADQAYAGVNAETAMGRAAVAATRGRVLTWQGELVDAFFFSTCGGRTARGTEIFRAADRPYLRSIEDIAPDGSAYCSASPRFRWEERWSGAQLRATLQATLPEVMQLPASSVDRVRNVEVTRTSGSGRAAELAIALDRENVRVDAPRIRLVLRPRPNELLRSNTIELTVRHEGGRVSELVVKGRGAGHGVGFCQWGAVGRARTGQNAAQILSAYYPGSAITRRY